MNPEAATETGIKALHHHIDGRRIGGNSGRSGPIYDPSSGAVTAEVPLASKAEVKQAIAAADRAFPVWALTSA